MPKLVCVKCQTELKPLINGITLIEMAEFGPYKVWAADTWKCPGCGTEIVSGFSHQPLRQDHWEGDFLEWLEGVKKRAPAVVYDYERPTMETP